MGVFALAAENDVMASSARHHQEIVITGMGSITSVGSTARETFSALTVGRSGIRHFATEFDKKDSVPHKGPRVQFREALPLNISPREKRIMGRQGLMFLKTAEEAFWEAGLVNRNLEAEEIGIFAGAGVVDYELEALWPALRVCRNEDGSVNEEAFYGGGYREIHPLWPLSMLNNMPLCQVGIRLGIKGENAVFSPYGDAGMRALFEGAAAISEGRALAVLSGGISERISPLSLARDFSVRGEKASRKTCLGEGCGVVVLESGMMAKKRGARALAQLSGFGWAFGIEKNYTSVDAIQRAMLKCLKNAQTDPSRIDLVVCHLDGTHEDQKEMEALARVFAVTDKPIHLYGSKPSLGHLHAASPLVDAVLSVLMMEKGAILKTASFDLLQETGLFRLSPKPYSIQRMNNIMINTRSPEGQCASLILSACR